MKIHGSNLDSLKAYFRPLLETLGMPYFFFLVSIPYRKYQGLTI